MTGSGISGSLAKIFGYMLLIFLIAGTIIGSAIFILRRQGIVTEDENITGAFSRVFSSGRPVGREIPGINPPNLAERLASLSSSRSIVTPMQEVIMVGDAANSTCLGGDSEILIEVKNDIDADQLDVSFSPVSKIQDLRTSVSDSTILKIASCGKKSQVRQCIPAGKSVKLYATAYFFDHNSPSDPESFSEKKLEYPFLIDKTKSDFRSGFLASEFRPLTVS